MIVRGRLILKTVIFLLLVLGIFIRDTSAEDGPEVFFWSSISDPITEPSFSLFIIFDKEVSGFEESDLIVDNARISNFTSGNEGVHNIELEAIEEGLVRIVVPDNVAHDSDGNGNQPAEFQVNYETSEPAINLISPEDGEEEVPLRPEFNWQGIFDNELYQVQLFKSSEPSMEELVKDSVDVEENELTMDTDLEPERTYSWRVRSYTELDTTEWSEAWSFSTLPERPLRPILISPGDNSEKVSLEPRFLWGSVDNADSYEFQLATDAFFNNIIENEEGVTTTDYQPEEPLEQNSQYYWRVRAENDRGQGYWSTTFSFTTIEMEPEQVVLEEPSDSLGSIPVTPHLNWLSADNATGYRVEINNSSTGETEFFYEDIEESEIQITDSLSFYEIYNWRVQAYNDHSEGEWSEVEYFVTEAQAPEPGFPTANASDISIAPRISWADPHDALNYELRLTKQDQPGDENEEIVVSEKYAELTGLEANTEYYWQVRIADELTSSSWSEIRDFSTRNDPQFQQELSASITFDQSAGDDIAEEDYRLIGLPGADDIPLDEVIEGDYNQDWRAFSDTGDEVDYLKEFNFGANQFKFGGGAGYWVYSRNQIDFDKQIEKVELNEYDAYAIELKPGWNIITNPFTNQVIWEDVLILNDIEADLYAFNHLFETASVMEPTQAYYFYNNPNRELDELHIPYGDFENRIKQASGDSEEYNKDKMITLEGRFSGNSTNMEDLTTSVEIIFEQDNYTKGVAPHPSLEMSRYGVTLENEDQENERAFRTISADQNTLDEPHKMNVKAPVGETITWQADLHGFDERKKILLVNPVTNVSHLLDGESMAKSEVTEPEVSYKLYIGNESDLKKRENELLPEEISLKANYPNPFNPVTTIRFAITDEDRVNLEVYDVLGRKVKTLFDEQKQAGWHTVEFDGSGMSSGTYIYRLNVGNEVKTGKMMLVK